MGLTFMVQAVKEDYFALEDGIDRCVTSQKTEDLISSIVHMLYPLIITSLLVKEEGSITNIVIVIKYRLLIHSVTHTNKCTNSISYIN